MGRGICPLQLVYHRSWCGDDLRYVLHSFQLGANRVVEAPALVHEELVQRTGLGQGGEDLDAFDFAWVDHADECLVPVALAYWQYVRPLVEIRPGMMYEKIRS